MKILLILLLSIKLSSTYMFKDQDIGVYFGNQDPELPHTIKTQKTFKNTVDELQMILDKNRKTENLDIDTDNTLDEEFIDKMLE